jgi:uncharacterized protein YuzE
VRATAKGWERAVRNTYDPEVDAAYIAFGERQPGETATTQHIAYERPGVGELILDFSEAGRLMGMELLGARGFLDPAYLATFEEI